MSENRAKRRRDARAERKGRPASPTPIRARRIVRVERPEGGWPAGRLNRYTCQRCNGSIVTIDLDEGTTPFMLRCRSEAVALGGCGAMMVSAFYRHVVGEPAFAWKTPTPIEYASASPGMREHFDKGGLDLYPLVVDDGAES